VSRSEEEIDELVGEDGGGSSSVAGSSIVECSKKCVGIVTTIQLNTSTNHECYEDASCTSNASIYPNNKFKLLNLIPFLFASIQILNIQLHSIF